LYEKIGDIGGIATTYGQMGILYNDMKEFPTALEYSIRAFLIFSEIKSTKTFRVVKDITTVRVKLSESVNNEILRKYDISPDSFEEIG
jgi:hypothetical protein